jgi:inosine-uridine nucleoside N-ribohydrolase
MLGGSHVKNLIALVGAMLIAQSEPAYSSSLERHFLGEWGQCVKALPIPVLIVADVTRSGEIDDSISLFIYSRLEKMNCIRVIGVASIFGNGGSTTRRVHKNLVARLHQLKLTNWPVFHGPMHRVPYESNMNLTEIDRENLERIAAQIKAYKKVVISELGPLTISASLLKAKLITSDNVIKIVGVGGRAEGEHFSQNSLPFSLRDMNVAEDRMAVNYLLKYHPSKLWMVTYRTGIGARMISPEMVGDVGSRELMAHAYSRAKMLKIVGYRGMIPSWDTWTTSWFIRGGSHSLGCYKMKAHMAYAETGYKPTDSMQLRLVGNSSSKGSRIEACHVELKF